MPRIAKKPGAKRISKLIAKYEQASATARKAKRELQTAVAKM